MKKLEDPKDPDDSCLYFIASERYGDYCALCQPLLCGDCLDRTEWEEDAGALPRERPEDE